MKKFTALLITISLIFTSCTATPNLSDEELAFLYTQNFQVGMLNMYNEEYELASENFTEAISYNPENEKAYLGLYHAYFNQEMYTEAKDALLSSSEFITDNPEINARLDKINIIIEDLMKNESENININSSFEEIFYSDGTSFQTTTLYASDNLIASITAQNSDGAIVREETYQYDDNQNKTRYQILTESYSYYTDYKYDKNDNMILSDYYFMEDGSYFLVGSNKFEYNKDNTLIYRYTDTFGEDELDEEYTYTYKDDLLMSYNHSVYTPDYTTSSTDEYIYDENNRLTSVVTTSTSTGDIDIYYNNNEITTRYYKYNEYGNLIEIETFVNYEINAVRKQSYTYFDDSIEVIRQNFGSEDFMSSSREIYSYTGQPLEYVSFNSSTLNDTYTSIFEYNLAGDDAKQTFQDEISVLGPEYLEFTYDEKYNLIKKEEFNNLTVTNPNHLGDINLYTYDENSNLTELSITQKSNLEENNNELVHKYTFIYR